MAEKDTWVFDEEGVSSQKGPKLGLETPTAAPADTRQKQASQPTSPASTAGEASAVVTQKIKENTAATFSEENPALNDFAFDLEDVDFTPSPASVAASTPANTVTTAQSTQSDATAEKPQSQPEQTTTAGAPDAVEPSSRPAKVVSSRPRMRRLLTRGGDAGENQPTMASASTTNAGVQEKETNTPDMFATPAHTSAETAADTLPTTTATKSSFEFDDILAPQTVDATHAANLEEVTVTETTGATQTATTAPELNEPAPVEKTQHSVAHTLPPSFEDDDFWSTELPVEPVTAESPAVEAAKVQPSQFETDDVFGDLLPQKAAPAAQALHFGDDDLLNEAEKLLNTPSNEHNHTSTAIYHDPEDFDLNFDFDDVSGNITEEDSSEGDYINNIAEPVYPAASTTGRYALLGNSFDDLEDKLVLSRDLQTEAAATHTDDAYSDQSGRFYKDVMETLLRSEDLGVSSTAKEKLRSVIDSQKLPQLAMHELVAKHVVDKNQLGRAVARTQGRREITSFADIPPEATRLRQELDSSVLALLRDKRIIPLIQSHQERGRNELHLGADSVTPDLILEAALRDLLPGYRFVWHYALREVCGAFWLAGEGTDVDASMEAEALLDRIIGTAIDARSSDIHIDPSVKGEMRAIVKYRIDGVVTPKDFISLEQLDRLRVRIENVARMPKVDQNHPNKGAFTRAGYDWRVQIQPHAGRQGPVSRIVIRRLQPEVMPMEALGYPEYFIKDIKAAASASNGVIFWTGPTGSGKTESIHSAVVSVNPMGRGLSVHTIEDPPEKRVSGYAVQMEISENDPSRSGLELLKSSLRADPDVVIFGEVRDAAMAKLVFEAANTGHLVFTTLHTNTALDSVVRLDELGVNGFMLSYIRGIASQRLVRRLCTHCRQKMDKPDDFTRYVFDKYEVDLKGAKLYKAHPEGCASCNFTGYHGRIAICEWLVPNREVVELSQNHTYERLEEAARRAGWKPMGYMGVLHVKNGITDAQELASKVLELSTVKK